jgi:ribosomal protein S18 acetylase RimI-like enzyme
MFKISKSTKEEIKEFNAKEMVATDVIEEEEETKLKFESFVFKCELDGVIVGTIFGKIKAKILFIDDIIVTASKRRLGIGRSLMEKAEDFGRKRQIDKLNLITGVDWQAKGFYNALGYKIKDEFNNFSKTADYLIYEKEL